MVEDSMVNRDVVLRVAKDVSIFRDVGLRGFVNSMAGEDSEPLGPFPKSAVIDTCTASVTVGESNV